MSSDSIDGVTLDHVAHAVPRWQDVWTRYAVDLGAEWSSGGPGPGFAPAQLRFGNGARVEVLMPYDPQVNDFLQRFIATSGPGPHHLTFKVPHLLTAIDRARRSGYEPIGIDLSDPEWLEAFIHPKQATGVVVQLAEAPNSWHGPAPDDYPRGRRPRQDGSGPVPAARLVRVVHAVADLAEACTLFVGLLGGTVVDQGARPDHRWTDLGWGGPLGVRLVSPVDTPSSESLARWLGDRSGRVHHLELVAEEPETVPGVRPGNPTIIGLDTPQAGTSWVVEAEVNAGLGLVIHAP